MERYIYASRQRTITTLFLDRSYILGDEATWVRVIVVTYHHTTVDRSINRIRRYIAQRFRVTIHALPALRLTDRDFIINILDELSPQDIIGDSLNWGPRFEITVDKFEGEPERLRPASFRVTVHLKTYHLNSNLGRQRSGS
jgi:hypothetical protein